MALRTSNPTLSDKTFNRYAYLTGTDASERMTLAGTLNKCLILGVLLFASASAGWILTTTNVALGIPLLILGCVASLGCGIATAVKPQWSSVLAPIYAVVEGAAVGAISTILNTKYPGIAAQAFVATCGVMLTMFSLYRAGILRATPTFIRVVVVATLGIGVMYLLALGLRLFGAEMPLLNSAGPLGIGISVFICVVAALNFILDFNLIEKGAEAGAPKFMEWYAAFSLMVTVVWLYLEILRLLAKLRR